MLIKNQDWLFPEEKAIFKNQGIETVEDGLTWLETRADDFCKLWEADCKERMEEYYQTYGKRVEPLNMIQILTHLPRFINCFRMALKKPIRLVKFVRTDEDWYGTYKPGPEILEENLKRAEQGLSTTRVEYINTQEVPAVRVTLNKMVNSRRWVIHVWGNDDHGLDLWNLTLKQAKKIYHSLRGPITHQQLYDLGFKIT